MFFGLIVYFLPQLLPVWSDEKVFIVMSKASIQGCEIDLIAHFKPVKSFMALRVYNTTEWGYFL